MLLVMLHLLRQFITASGQNLIEAASLGKPILIGPHTFNFAEATKNGIAAGAVIQVNNIEELSKKIEYLFKNKTQREQIGQAGKASAKPL